MTPRPDQSGRHTQIHDVARVDARSGGPALVAGSGLPAPAAGPALRGTPASRPHRLRGRSGLAPGPPVGSGTATHCGPRPHRSWITPLRPTAAGNCTRRRSASAPNRGRRPPFVAVPARSLRTLRKASAAPPGRHASVPLRLARLASASSLSAAPAARATSARVRGGEGEAWPRRARAGLWAQVTPRMERQGRTKCGFARRARAGLVAHGSPRPDRQGRRKDEGEGDAATG